MYPAPFQKAIAIQSTTFQSAPADQEVAGSKCKRPPQHFWGVLSGRNPQEGIPRVVETSQR